MTDIASEGVSCTDSARYHAATVDVYDEIAEIYDGMIPDPEGFTKFYLDVVGDATRRVLYAGCGTGRLLEEIARRGNPCIGVDPSRASVDAAQRRLTCLPRASATVDSLPGLATVSGAFDRVIVAGGAFEYLLTTSEQVAALRRLRELCASDGVIVLDVSAPPFATDDIRGNYVGVVAGSAKCAVSSSSVTFGYDHFRQLLRSTCTFEFERGREPVTVQYFTRYTTISEWRLLLAASGLTGDIFGDFARGPVTRTSSSFVICASRSGE